MVTYLTYLTYLPPTVLPVQHHTGAQGVLGHFTLLFSISALFFQTSFDLFYCCAVWWILVGLCPTTKRGVIRQFGMSRYKGKCLVLLSYPLGEKEQMWHAVGKVSIFQIYCHFSKSLFGSICAHPLMVLRDNVLSSETIIAELEEVEGMKMLVLSRFRDTLEQCHCWVCKPQVTWGEKQEKSLVHRAPLG